MVQDFQLISFGNSLIYKNISMVNYILFKKKSDKHFSLALNLMIFL